MKKVTVTVNRDGTVEVDVNGVQGSSCQNYTEAVRKALGGEVIKDEKKPEFYLSNDNTAKVTQDK